MRSRMIKVTECRLANYRELYVLCNIHAVLEYVCEYHHSSYEQLHVYVYFNTYDGTITHAA